MLDGGLDDGVRRGECLLDLHHPGVRDQREDAGVPGRDGVLELAGELVAVVLLPDLAGRGPGSAQGRRAADDRRREDDAERDPADQAPLCLLYTSDAADE